MATIKRNILANLAGGAAVAALTLIITPLQVHILGVEAYGIVGFIATLQTLFSVLDFGLSSTLTRELAGDTSRNKSASAPLLRTASTVYWCLALVIGACLAGIAAVVGMALPTAVIGGTIDLSRVTGGECCRPAAPTDACCSGDSTKAPPAG